jgi:hypothetical protein
MSLAKAVPDGLKDCECKKTALRERPPIPYVLEKDSVQDTVSFFKENHLKTLINKGTKLQVPIWHSGTKKHCDFCKKHEGAYTTHNTCDCRWFEKDGTEKSDFRAAKKGGRKPNPTKQSFAKLEKVIKKKDTKKRKRHSSDSDSDSE